MKAHQLVAELGLMSKVDHHLMVNMVVKQRAAARARQKVPKNESVEAWKPEKHKHGKKLPDKMWIFFDRIREPVYEKTKSGGQVKGRGLHSGEFHIYP